jgi:hypothetical protein
MQVMAPALALSGSTLVLAAAVVAKSALFAVFERRLPHLRAAWRMFLGNVLTSFVGLLVGMMIASGAGLRFVGVPVVCLLCWLPSQEARPGGSSGMAGANIPRSPGWDYDWRSAGELHSVHGGPSCDRDSRTSYLLDHQAGSHLSSFAG